MEQITPETIISAFADIDDEYIETLVRSRKSQISAIFKRLSVENDKITPPVGNIFEAFRQCPYSKLRVILIGQDPYPGAGHATGMSFSVAKGIYPPPSLRLITECLLNNELINKKPSHGDLSAWAHQGVLMLNTALTTTIGNKTAHMDIWQDYIRDIARDLCEKAQNPIIIIALGAYAQSRAADIAKNTTNTPIVLSWGHPSPISSNNKRKEDPKHFIHCDVFTKTNDILTKRNDDSIIDWNWE